MGSNYKIECYWRHGSTKGVELTSPEGYRFQLTIPYNVNYRKNKIAEYLDSQECQLRIKEMVDKYKAVTEKYKGDSNGISTTT